MRPLGPPATHVAIANVTGRARNLERRYIPTADGILDWVWVISLTADVPTVDVKLCSGASISGSSASSGFSVVTDTVTSVGLTAPYDCSVLRCPADTYLAVANLIVSGLSPSVNSVSNGWFYKILAKESVAGWNHEANPVWAVDQWRTPGLSANVRDPNVIPETLTGAAPIVVPDLGDGFGLVSLLVANDDTTTHFYGDGFLFLQALTLGVVGDALHGGTTPLTPTVPNTAPSLPTPAPGINGPGL